ncbi:MAG: hypothetical protein COA78_34695 [Blastopirellula sp.]|nr:MAG: hypothetical protein COA78_34695 [Blastopirellula sp.]
MDTKNPSPIETTTYQCYHAKVLSPENLGNDKDKSPGYMISSLSGLINKFNLKHCEAVETTMNQRT